MNVDTASNLTESENTHREGADQTAVAAEPAEPETNPAEYSMTIPVGGVNYTVTLSQADMERLSTIIKPKPIPNADDASSILNDHRQSVRNVVILLCNMAIVGAEGHDQRKLQQTPEEHHAEEVHHYPLDGFEIPQHFLPGTYVVEALADYIATTLGRALANRGMDWISPTKSEQLTDVFNATALSFFQYYGLGRIEPPIPLEAQR